MFIWFCLFLYIWTYFIDMFIHFLKNVPEVWTIFVRNISFAICCDFFVQYAPPHPRRQCQSSLLGNKYGKSYFSYFCDFYEKIIMNNVLKWLRRVAFVGWDVALHDFGFSFLSFWQSGLPFGLPFLSFCITFGTHFPSIDFAWIFHRFVDGFGSLLVIFGKQSIYNSCLLHINFASSLGSIWSNFGCFMTLLSFFFQCRILHDFREVLF